MQACRWTPKLPSPCGFYQSTNTSLEGSPVTLPLSDSRKMANQPAWEHSEWIPTVLQTVLGRWDSLAKDRDSSTDIPGCCREGSNRPLLPVQDLFFLLGCFGTQKQQLSSSQHVKGDSTWKENQMRKISFKVQLLNKFSSFWNLCPITADAQEKIWTFEKCVCNAEIL